MCTIVSNVLNCNFGNLANEQTRTVGVATNAAGGANPAACPGGVTLNNTAKVTGTGIPDKTDTGDYRCTPPPPPPVLSACTLGYPFTSAVTRTSTIFNESETLAGFSIGASGNTVQLFYTDEHAMLLGVRTAGFPVSPLNANPDHASPVLTGDPAQVDPAGRPFPPSLFITDVTNARDNAAHTSAAHRAFDWQFGGTATTPNDVFGTWKGASIGIVDKKKGTLGLLTDADPAQNHANLGGPGNGADPAVAGTGASGYGAEARWNINALLFNGQPLVPGRFYRLQFMVHDGDQNKTGGDVGEACTIIRR